ncbi:hypothetical protein [Microbacterium sp. 22296]|uniref:hypothetical protein n=1 Tax=Microbacterium sp. 22296 TaxID=3453903 RepID=UPI003F85B22D
MGALPPEVVGWIIGGSVFVVVVVGLNLLISFFVIRAAVVSALAADRAQRADEARFLRSLDTD